MPIQILPNRSGLGEGISGAASILSKAFEKRRDIQREERNKEADRQRNAQKEEADRQRMAQSGTILENVLGSLPQNATPQDFQSAMARAIQQGIDPTVINQFAPFIKEQAKLQGGQQYLNQIGIGQSATNIPSAQDGTPKIGSFYDQQDNVPDNITQTQIDQLIASPYPQHQALGKQYEARRTEVRKNWQADRDFHAKGLKKIEENVISLRDTVEKRKNVLNLSKRSIESGEIGRLSRNAIANTIGGPIGDLLRTKSGADFALAAKENLVTSLGQISARGTNMFMEQRLLDAFAKVGQSEAANLSVQNFFETENALDQAYLTAYDKLAAQDMERYGYERKDLDKRAREAAGEDQQKIFNQSVLRNREYIEKEKGPYWMAAQTTKKVDKGTPLTAAMFQIFNQQIGDPEKALIRAKQLGYTVYSPDMFAGGI